MKDSPRAGGKHKRRIADMSVPSGQRGRKQKAPRKSKRVPAQMDHATNPKARKFARQGEQKMKHGRKGNTR
jgi:hypothetical protein